MLAGGWDRQTSKVPDDEESQIDQAFDNVQEALRVAGVENGWEKVSSVRDEHCLRLHTPDLPVPTQVYKVTSYHVPVSDTGISAMIRNLRKYCPGHQPVWTLIGPAKLAFPEMKVEIQVEAHVATGVAQ